MFCCCLGTCHWMQRLRICHSQSKLRWYQEENISSAEGCIPRVPDSNGHIHNILIECDAKARDPLLSIWVDKHLVVHVKRLVWKFRGNQTILVDGLPIELFWDVHNWLFSPTSDDYAIFMFQTRSMSSSKSWSSLATSSSSLFQWQHTSSSSTNTMDINETNPGFSLLLYVWKVD